MEKLKRLTGVRLRLSKRTVVLIVILVIGFDLRIQSTLHSVVRDPIRADAYDYAVTALNINKFHVYSLSNDWDKTERSEPPPDARRPPMYPIFLSFFLGTDPTYGDLRNVLLAQALLSTITIWLVYLLARSMLSTQLAVAATFLTALSPHLVTMNIYALTETLFCFLLVLTILTITQAMQHGRAWVAMVAGLALGTAALTHFILLYFVIPLAIFQIATLGWKAGRKKVGLLLLGFALIYGPWAIRNVVTLGNVGDGTQMAVAIKFGSYNNMMYHDDPQTYAYPYSFDPTFDEGTISTTSAIHDVFETFREAPLQQIAWYVKKPFVAWGWDMAEGQGDVFLYPTPRTPYKYLPHFRVSHFLMKLIHPLLVALMMGGIALAWLPSRWTRFSATTVYCARIVSLLILYHAAVMTAGFPLPRYSIPLRPFLYIMAMLFIFGAVNWIRARQHKPAIKSATDAVARS